MSNHTDFAWAAGVFEGEGWICLGNKAGRFRLYAGITNTDMRLLKPFLEWWGGRIRPRKGTALSKKDLYEWRLENILAHLFLNEIRPFLRTNKADQADVAMEFHKRVRPTGRRRDTRGRMLSNTAEELAWRRDAIKRLRAARLAVSL